MSAATSLEKRQQIVVRKAMGASTSAIAEAYGVDPSTVRKILKRAETGDLAPRNFDDWSRTEDRMLREEAKRSRATYGHIAAKIGRSRNAVRHRAHALGIRLKSIAELKPKQEPVMDDRAYVAALMALGGFPAWDERVVGVDRLGRRKVVACAPLTYPQRPLERAA